MTSARIASHRNGAIRCRSWTDLDTRSRAPAL